MGVWKPAALGSVVCAAMLVAWTGRAAAQISESFLDDWQLAYRFSHTSARLDAMGGVSVAVQDEADEINMWDYGRNVAGFLVDRDAWTGDFWAANSSVNRRANAIPSSGSNAEGGVQISFRSYERALGVEGGLTRGTVEGGSGTDFERHKFSGPTFSVVGNQALGERAVLGVSLSAFNEDDDVTARDALAIAHATDRLDYKFGVVYFLNDQLDLGATLSLSSNSVSGVSSSGLHRDRYTWDRPITEFGAQATYYGRDGALQGGAFVSRSLLDGGEILRISWAREFFLNPSGVDLNLRIPILTEERKQTTVGTRWLLSAGRRVEVGASVLYEKGTYEATGHPTWSRFVRTTNDEFDATTFKVGAGLHPHARLLVTGELNVTNGDLTSEAFENVATTTDEITTLRTGVEYFWVSDLIVRGGFVLTQAKRDQADRISATNIETERRRYSAGLGWAPRGGVFMIDLAFGITNGETTVPSDPLDETDGASFTLAGRTLFR